MDDLLAIFFAVLLLISIVYPLALATRTISYIDDSFSTHLRCNAATKRFDYIFPAKPLGCWLNETVQD